MSNKTRNVILIIVALVLARVAWYFVEKNNLAKDKAENTKQIYFPKYLYGDTATYDTSFVLTVQPN